LFLEGADQAPQPFDLNSKLINTPDSNWSVYGPDQTSKLLAKGGPHDYPAVEATVRKAGKNAWDDGAVSPISKAIGAGDVILVAVYLRGPNLADGQSETLPLIGATGPLRLIRQSRARLRGSPTGGLFISPAELHPKLSPPTDCR
jgi:hypothetical protein